MMTMQDTNISKKYFVQNSNIFSHAALFIFGVYIVACILFYGMKNFLQIGIILSLYPYFIAILFFGVGLPIFLSKRYISITNMILKNSFILFSVLFCIVAYHFLILNEEFFNIFYAIRFYFGVFIFLFSFLVFISFLGIEGEIIKKWHIRMIEFIIIISFVVSVVEFVGIIYGVNPELFVWITRDIENIKRFQDENIVGAIRAYGIASNSAVLGGFSAFLVTYYYSQIMDAIKFKNIIILACCFITILLTKSGTGYIAGFMALYFILISKRRNKVPYVVLSLFIIFLGFYLNVLDKYRFSVEYLEIFGGLAIDTINTYAFYILDNYISILFGVMIYMGTQMDLNTRASMYDYTMVGFLFEVGLLGVFMYFFLLFKCVKTAFPKNRNIERGSFIILVVSTLHYPVVFFIITQVMVALILAVNIYIKENSKLVIT